MAQQTNSKQSEKVTILRNAADIIRLHGWNQGRPKDPEGRKCISGALVYSILEKANKLPIEGTSEFAVFLELKKDLGFTLSNSMSNWNDNPSRTSDQVIELLENTAKDLEQREQGPTEV